MNGEAHHVATCPLHVVDTAESPYRSVFHDLLGRDVSLAFHGTASAALRAARKSVEGVWFVSIDLPDLPGPQLIEMLVGLSGDKLIVAVGDTYSPEDETAALASGACQYFVKPLGEHRCRAVIEVYLSADTESTDCDELLEMQTLRS